MSQIQKLLVQFKLKKTLEKLNKAYSLINHGGCGYFAKEFGSILKAKGIQHKYYLLVSSLSNVKEAIKRIEAKDIDRLNMYVHWTHVMVNVDDKLIDAEDVVDISLEDGYKRKGRHYLVELPEDLLHEWLTPEYDSHWNYTFDRKKVPVIREVLNKNLNKSLLKSIF